MIDKRGLPSPAKSRYYNGISELRSGNCPQNLAVPMLALTSAIELRLMNLIKPDIESQVLLVFFL